jgi:SecD/SecF fusion protein
MFALMVGVVVGTYSSLFVASPIMMDTIKKKEEK